MELDLYLKMCPDMVVRVFCAIAAIVLVISFFKSIVIMSKHKNPKEKKEVEFDDNRGNQKRSTKTDVH